MANIIIAFTPSLCTYHITTSFRFLSYLTQCKNTQRLGIFPIEPYPVNATNSDRLPHSIGSRRPQTFPNSSLHQTMAITVFWKNWGSFQKGSDRNNLFLRNYAFKYVASCLQNTTFQVAPIVRAALGFIQVGAMAL